MRKSDTSRYNVRRYEFDTLYRTSSIEGSERKKSTTRQTLAGRENKKRLFMRPKALRRRAHPGSCGHTRAITIRDETVYVYSRDGHACIFMQVCSGELSIRHARNGLDMRARHVLS